MENSAFPPTVSEEKYTYPQCSGSCILTTPCGDHTQLYSGRNLPLASFFLEYLPSVRSKSQFTLEKLRRQKSSSGILPSLAASVITFQGSASSTLQPPSLSEASFKVPLISTADLTPWMSQLSKTFPPLR